MKPQFKVNRERLSFRKERNISDFDTYEKLLLFVQGICESTGVLPKDFKIDKDYDSWSNRDNMTLVWNEPETDEEMNNRITAEEDYLKQLEEDEIKAEELRIKNKDKLAEIKKLERKAALMRKQLEQ